MTIIIKLFFVVVVPNLHSASLLVVSNQIPSPITTTTRSSPWQQQQKRGLRYSFLETDCEKEDDEDDATFLDFYSRQQQQEEVGETSFSAIRRFTIPKVNTINNSSSIDSDPQHLTQCLPSLGIQADGCLDHPQYPRLYSEYSSKVWLQDITKQASGVSFSLWIKPFADEATTQSQPQSLLVIGRRWDPSAVSTNSGGVQLTDCDRYQFDLHAVQQYDFMDIFFRTADTLFEPCQRLRVHNFLSRYKGNITHLTISLMDANQQIYVNGKLEISSNQRFRDSLLHWNYDYGLSLLSYPGFIPWPGVLYQFEVAPGGRSAQDVQSQMLSGLDPSPPFAIEYSITIHEDAENEPGSHPPQWYSNHFTSIPTSSASEAAALLSQLATWFFQHDAARIPLRIGSPQREALQLLKTLGMAPQNETIVVYKYLTRLPLFGSLFLDDGQPLREIPGCQNSDDQMLLCEITYREIVYLPPHNEHSVETAVPPKNSTSTNGNLLDPFATFEYCVSAEPLLDPRHCKSATVTIFVTPVNDPPIPISYWRSPIQIWEGSIVGSPAILLSGSDVDRDDGIAAVQVTSPPAYGFLVSYVGTFRQDGVLHGTDLVDLDYRISGLDQVYVQYKWDPFSRFHGALQSVVQDKFTFRVADQSGRWSVEETVPLEIHSALFLEDCNQTVHASVRQTGGYTVNLKILDISGYNRSLGVFLDSSVPLLAGELLDPHSHQQIPNGTLLPSRIPSLVNVSSTVIEILFVPRIDLCRNSPKQDHLLVFIAKAVAFDSKTNIITSVSERAEQHIHVHCDADRMRMTHGEQIQPNQMSIIQSNPRWSSLDPCREAKSEMRRTELFGCPRAFIIRGIKVSSETPLSWIKDLVVVEVTTKTGYLTFNKHSWDKTRPITGRRVQTKGLLRFRVYPSDMESTINSLQYQSFVPGMDSIDIAVYQGNCSSSNNATAEIDMNITCIDYARAPDCYIARCSLEIMVESDKELDHFQTCLIPEFPWQIIVCLFGYPLIYFGMVRLESSRCGGGSSSRDYDGGDDDHQSTAIDIEEEDIIPEWIQYETEEGDFYYENIVTGEVTWMAPVGGEPVMLAWEEIYRGGDE